MLSLSAVPVITVVPLAPSTEEVIVDGAAVVLARSSTVH